MDKHRKITGTLFLFQGLLITLILYSVVANNPDMPFINILMGLSFGLIAIISGYGLLMKMPWMHKVSIPAAILAFFAFPLGTALSIYYFWFYKKYAISKT